MSKIKHSPLPWRVGYHDGSGMGTIVTKKRSRSWISKMLLPRDVARLHWGCGCCDSGEEGMTDEDKANARHIVISCNYHERLVAMVEELLGGTDVSEILVLRERARRLLAEIREATHEPL